MTRLPTLSSRQLVAALKKAGFVLVRQRSSHYQMHHPTKNHRTLVPLHGDNLKRSLFKAIIKQAGLTEDEFRKLIE